ncbi:FAD-binding oxidoreductase [Sphingomonas faeni]|uniref:FAD-binding oxidoreductase n=1 Tax=Sphingomonas faeni TaxID=185950 RepID=UPI0020C75DFF|nr:FAD-binding oxidoreductase [Sphingomonas faeni]MCP8891014.1 FAD-binding oxidoreductase [Sphingomonas faeni]
MKLPPNVSQADFTAALKAFAAIVGNEWLFTSDEDLELYRDSYSVMWDEAAEPTASAAVAPDTSEQVVELIKIANRYKIPVYPISTGKNLGYGGAAPAVAGSVVLDLKRMNRIVEIDERNGYVVVEPGVSYFDLYSYIQEKGLKLWIDCPSPGWGSLIGNALDGGVGVTLASYRNHFDAQCGIEVVLPNGRMMRTGMGAMPNARTWQQFRPGFGPRIDGLFKQSNFGVVTKMGFWLMPPPENFATGVVTVPKFRDLIPLVDVIGRLEQSKIVQGLWTLSSPTTGVRGDAAHIVGGVPPQIDPRISAVLNDPAGADMTKLDVAAQAAGVPFWACEFNLYGPGKLITAQWDCIRDAIGAAVPSAQFTLNAIRTLPLPAAELAGLFDTGPLGIPSLRTFSMGPMISYEGEDVVGHVFFSPVIPRTGEAAIEAMDVFAAIARKYKLPSPPLQFPSSIFERAFLFAMGLPVTRSTAVNAKVREIVRELVAVAAEHGWGEYRTAPAFYDVVMETYSYNDHALRDFLETIKDAVDPNGIMSVGRYGIRPRQLRKAKA